MGWIAQMFGLELDGPARGASASGYGETPAPTNVSESKFFGENPAWSGNQKPSVGSAEAAAQASAVYFCCSIIAVIMGSLPREIRDAQGNVVSDTPLGNLLNDVPNRLQTGDQFWASMLYRAALAGVAYAEPVESELGLEIWPLEPLRTAVDWEDRDFTVSYLPARGPMRYFRPVDLFWIAGVADASARPLTPWRMAKGSIDFALALEKQGRDFFANGNRIMGLLSTDFELEDDQLARLKQGVREWKNGSIPVLEKGLSFESTSSNNSDAQMTELIRQRTLELARYWHIPKSLVGEDASGKSNHEQEALDFVKYCIRPWARLIEQAVRNRLMTPDQRRKWWFKLNLDGLLRGDSATQFRNAVLARTASSHSINDIRDWFGLPRIDEPWANDPREPLNSNRAADTISGGMTSPQDQQMRAALQDAGVAAEEIDEMFPLAAAMESE